MQQSSQELQGIVAQMLKPLKNLPLSVVIEGLSKHYVILFDEYDNKDQQILETLKKVADDVLATVNRRGINKSRANEVGNAIEPFVKNSLNKYDYQSNTPRASNRKRKASGYPDIEFIDEFNRLNYLECKTYSIDKINDTQRSFFISPSKDFKVCQNAHHFGISFAMEKPVNNIYHIHSWKILDLGRLKLNVKYEFNANNKNLYADNVVIAKKP